MKKTFLARRNALFSSTEVSWGAYAIAVSVLLLFVRLLAPNFFWQAVTPLFRSSDYLAAESRGFLLGFSDATKIALQNADLMEQKMALENENQILREKSANLEALFGSSVGKASASGILAGVVARPPESPYDILVVAEGSGAGVTEGQEAFAAGGVPIGIVSSVTDNFSHITLFSSVDMTLHGWVGITNIPLTIYGEGGGALVATISRSANVAIGDTVSVPGPGALPIGRVVRVDSDPASPSVMLRIMPSINIFSVTWVVLRDTGASFGNAFTHATSTGL